MNMINSIKAMVVAKEIRNVDGIKIAKDIMASFKDGAKLLVLAGHFCSFAGRVYKRLGSDDDLIDTLGIIVNRMKVHIANLIEGIMKDEILMAAGKDFSTRMENDLDEFQDDADVLKDLAEKVQKDFSHNKK